MLKWQRQKSDKQTHQALGRLEERLETLSAVVDEQGRTIRNLELEWIATYDKVRHQLSRMAKRGSLPATEDSSATGSDSPTGNSQMDPISAKIHARRNRGFLKPPTAEG